MENAGKIIVVGLGEILWDLLPTGRHLGGAPTNFAYHANAQGMPAAAVSCIGDDTLGRDILAQVAAWGMTTDYIFVDPTHPTGTVEVQVDDRGVPSYTIHEEVAWDYLPWNEPLAALAAQVQAVCFGSLGQRSPIARDTIQRFLTTTAPDCLRVCDINLRQHYYNTPLLVRSLELASVLKLNDDELPVIASALGISGTTEKQLSTLRERFELSVVALTRGGSGSFLVTADQISEHPGVATTIVDTVGAGDAFTAALIAGLLRGDSLDKINAAANATAASVCAHAGAIPS